MTYLEACDALVSREEARREVTKHGVEFSEFLAEVGDRETYTGEEVLGWLGY